MSQPNLRKVEPPPSACNGTKFSGLSSPALHVRGSRRATTDMPKRKSNETADGQLANLFALVNKPGPRYLIDPNKSNWLARWDMLGGLILIYTAIGTPYEVVFLRSPEDMLDGRFLFNRAIDAFFLLDLILQFFIMYPQEKVVNVKSQEDTVQSLTRSRQQKKGQGAGSALSDMVTSHAMIVRHYLCGWFLIDFVSVLSLAVDVLPIVLALEVGDDVANEASRYESVRLLRLLRVLRLLKLIRLLRSVSSARRLSRCASGSCPTLPSRSCASRAAASRASTPPPQPPSQPRSQSPSESSPSPCVHAVVPHSLGSCRGGRLPSHSNSPRRPSSSAWGCTLSAATGLHASSCSRPRSRTAHSTHG